MINHTDDSTFTIPLTYQVHETAEQFRQQQSNPQKAKQVYLNTLAVQAVNRYLELLGIATDLTASDSWNPIMQSLADVADLVIQGQGKLECRPVLPNAQFCYVPAEVWTDRIGYVVVQFDVDLTEATLLGVVPTVNALEVPLAALRSLDELFDYLNPHSNPVNELQRVGSSIIQLSRWLEDVVDSGWQTVEQCFGLQQPAFSMRGPELETLATGENLVINRAKPLMLGSYETGEEIILMVGVILTMNGERTIWVRVVPFPGQAHLPTALDVLILDETGAAVMQAQSRQTEMIQLRFMGQAGEKFGVRLVLGTDSITESFVI